eukprot:GFKZ01009893.1.p1 GENE.GFKZ01009893.1~~GFKZ01009893.1.p1  ORF type:complete len:478 (+),score=75.75 GFKZ01009893.1:171-1436(+)
MSTSHPPPRSPPRPPRNRSPSYESDRKRHRPNPPPRSRSYYHSSNHYPSPRSPYDRPSRQYPSHSQPSKRHYYSNAPRSGNPRYENGYSSYQPSHNNPHHHQRQPFGPPAIQPASKSRRLYIGNIPFQAGLTDVALTQFFSALYIAGFRPNRKGEPLPVISFWLHGDGKFGFMELRGEQEAVNMMQFNGVFLHGRPLRVNRPSDYRPDLHNPQGLSLVPEGVNIVAVMELCAKLGPVVAAPAQLAAISAAQGSGPAIPSGMQDGKDREAPERDTLECGEKVREEGPADRELAEEKKPMKTEQSGKEEAQGKSSKADPDLPSVVLLKDLITDEDLDADKEDFDELVSDILTECRGHGEVRDLIVPKKGRWTHSAIVEYANNEDAVRAIEALRQRVFDKSKINASLLEEYATASEAVAASPSK